MNPETAAIIEKLKKLLRMKRGGTPDEIATALELARSLAEKHGIDLNGIDPDAPDREKRQPITHADIVIGGRIQWECNYASLICNEFFEVKVFVNQFAWRKSGLTFVGTAWDVEIAQYVYHFLVGHFRREWRDKRGRCRNRRAFMFGMLCGLASKLRARRPKQSAGLGIVPVSAALQERKNYIALHFGDLTQTKAAPDSDAAAAENRGWQAGQDTEIRSGLEGNTPAQQLLNPTNQLTQ